MMQAHSTEFEASSCFAVRGCMMQAHLMGLEAGSCSGTHGRMMGLEVGSCSGMHGRMMQVHLMGLEASSCFEQVQNRNSNLTHNLIAGKLPAETRSHFVQVRYMDVLVLVRASTMPLLAVAAQMVRNLFEEDYCR